MTTKIEDTYDTYEQAYLDYKQRWQVLQNAVVGNTGCSAILAAEQHRKSHTQLQELFELSNKVYGLEFTIDGMNITRSNIDKLLAKCQLHKKCVDTWNQKEQLKSVGKRLHICRYGVEVRPYKKTGTVILFDHGTHWTCKSNWTDKSKKCGTGSTAREAYLNMSVQNLGDGNMEKTNSGVYKDKEAQQTRGLVADMGFRAHCSQQDKKMTTEPIQVWSFDKAPEELKTLSTGGDEDWVAVVPPEYGDTYIPWLDDGNFGPCSVHCYDHPTKLGYKVKIGTHS